jgi:hypothetical protein
MCTSLAPLPTVRRAGPADCATSLCITVAFFYKALNYLMFFHSGDFSTRA